ncbi:NAD(P)H-dependent oxidoreductase [Pseudomonas putida]
MHTLIVTAHPETTSLTHSIAAQLSAGIAASDTAHVIDMAHLAQEGFNPSFTEADLAVHRHKAAPAPDVRHEQVRIERADALVLVYPVYWWSMPALLKGWVDRVFSNGWAFDFDPQGSLTKHLGGLSIHLVGIGGADLPTYERYGYGTAMKAQIEEGIFGYCGAKVDVSMLLLNSENGGAVAAMEAAIRLGRSIGNGELARTACVS